MQEKERTQAESERLTVVMAMVELVCRRDSCRDSIPAERDCDDDASGRTDSNPLSWAATDDSEATAIKLITANNLTNHAIVPCRLVRARRHVEAGE